MTVITNIYSGQEPDLQIPEFKQAVSNRQCDVKSESKVAITSHFEPAASSGCVYQSRRGMAERLVGHGKSFASFGEIVQGRLSNGEDYLVTIPIDLWSTCELVCDPIDGASFIDTSFSKSREVAEHMLEILGMATGVKIGITFTRNIPIGKGLSSSTADMLAVVRAFQEVFGIIVTEEFISRLFAKIEPHDGLHYPMSVVYNHRQGKLLNKLNYIPDFNIIAVDAGGELSTVEYTAFFIFICYLHNVRLRRQRVADLLRYSDRRAATPCRQ